MVALSGGYLWRGFSTVGFTPGQEPQMALGAEGAHQGAIMYQESRWHPVLADTITPIADS